VVCRAALPLTAPRVLTTEGPNCGLCYATKPAAPYALTANDRRFLRALRIGFTAVRTCNSTAGV
jgi:hypothetical protein